MGDFSFEINSLNILERNKQLDYLENSLFIQDYIIILEDWYKSLKPAIGVKDNEGNRNKLYLGKNNVKSYWWLLNNYYIIVFNHKFLTVWVYCIYKI